MQIREIKKEAKERFALNRYHAMLVYGVVYTLALNICVLTTVLALLSIWAIWYGVILIFLFLLMLAPFGFGMTGFFIKLYKFEKPDAFHIFDGFNKYNLERVIVLRLLKFGLWLAFTLLLIVPGIVFSVRTSMATYILRANPSMKPADALKASNRIMKGHCFKYFGLVVSFAGWFLMGLLTCGLGYIWVMPYLNTAKIVFYKREIQGDTTVYRNPSENARVGVNAAFGITQASESASESDEIAFTAEIPPAPENTRNEEISHGEEILHDERRVSEENISAPPQEPHTVAAPERENPAFEQAAEELRRMDKMPLPGGRVFFDGEGRRVVDRRSYTPETETDAEGKRIYYDNEGRRAADRRRPSLDRRSVAANSESAVADVEISESGESIREQIARRRAERRSAGGARENTEIGDN